jgi:hypothetical protein
MVWLWDLEMYPVSYRDNSTLLVSFCNSSAPSPGSIALHHIRAVVQDCNASVCSFELAHAVRPPPQNKICSGDTDRPQRIHYMHHTVTSSQLTKSKGTSALRGTTLYSNTEHHIRAAHRPYYGHGRTMHNRLTDMGDRIPSIYWIPLSSDGTVWVAIRPYYGQRKYIHVQNSIWYRDVQQSMSQCSCGLCMREMKLLFDKH